MTNSFFFAWSYRRPPPTFWEAAADAILQQKLRQAAAAARQSVSHRFEDDEADDHDEYQSELHQHCFHIHNRTPTDTDDVPDDFPSGLNKNSERSVTSGGHHDEELFEKEHIRPPEIIINSENLSIKSYKSEI